MLCYVRLNIHRFGGLNMDVFGGDLLFCLFRKEVIVATWWLDHSHHSWDQGELDFSRGVMDSRSWTHMVKNYYMAWIEELFENFNLYWFGVRSDVSLSKISLHSPLYLIKTSASLYFFSYFPYPTFFLLLFHFYLVNIINMNTVLLAKLSSKHQPDWLYKLEKL